MRKISKRTYVFSVLAILLLAVLGIFFWHRFLGADVANSDAVHLTNYTDNDGPNSSIVLSGVIGDYGQAVRHEKSGKTVLDLKLTRGTLQLDVTTLDKRFSSAVGKAAFNQLTCSASVSVNGPASIVDRTGTGTYKNAKGTFTLTMSLDEVVPRGSQCNASNAMLSQALVTSGWGKVTL